MVLAKAVVFFFLLIALTGSGKSKAAVYKVGDSAGWTNVGHVDYRTWASIKSFRVGDIIVFEYNKQFHNVVRVNHKNFNACNSTGAYETSASGNDTFVVKKTGHYYFICSVPGHCESGQKVDIRVPGNPARSPSPTPPPIVTPPATSPPSSLSQPPRSPPHAQPYPSKPPSPHPVPPTPITPSPIPTPPTPPSSQPNASPPVNNEAPSPSPTSGSSLMYMSKGLIMLSALSLVFGIGW